MYDANKIVPGLIVFLAFLTFPMWYDQATGQAANVPNPQIVTQETQCVEPKEVMRAAHMEMLNSWRDQTVREGTRVFQTTDGREYYKSLSDTCLNCHSNKTQFCDQCHNYAGVQPVCWDCHIAPKENE